MFATPSAASAEAGLFTLSVLAGGLTDDPAIHLRVRPGESVRDVLDATEHRVRAACGGTGTCGACVVKFLAGSVNPLTLAEYTKLSAEERAAGVRLACQLRLRGDCEILLDHPAPPSQWMSIQAQDLAPASGSQPQLESHIYGVAVDLGTTHIRVALWDRKRGKRIATRRGPNPQAGFGADVLNRLDAALKRPEHARELAMLARAAIVQAVRDILARDVGEVTPMLAEIGEVVVVGNTAMLALLTENGAAGLIDPENWQARIDCAAPAHAEWLAQWFMPNAHIEIAAPVAGFIGSDLLADLVATRLTDGSAGAMLLDVGTNTEIALWDGESLHLTSTPGGPAFEGGGIRHGMAAEAGAIFRVSLSETNPGGTTEPSFKLETIADAPARGFCGSGLSDAVAALLRAGLLKPSGRFAVAPGPDGFQLDPANPRSAITGSDVDAFQRAKASLAAAMETLLQRAGMVWPDLTRLCVCGAFGHQLDIENAQAVGLLPPIDRSRIELFADASLAGCEQVLLGQDGIEWLGRLRDQSQSINLSLANSYDESFIDNLRLRRIPEVNLKGSPSL